MTGTDRALTRVVENQIEFIKRARALLGTEVKIQTIATLLEIANNPGITATELASRVNVSVAAAARNVSMLTHEGYPRGSGGLDLVKVEKNDPYDHKKNLCYLNYKGERTVRDIMGLNK